MPKRFCNNNPLVDVKYDYQTKLTDLPEAEGPCLCLGVVINGRGLLLPDFQQRHTIYEAPRIYRPRTPSRSFYSLKSEIENKLVWVWSEDNEHAVLLIGFIA